ncbi:MAG: MFS transporter [Gammaproteobacteria bacterium]|nr:MFS transporter [Gammaproteobacteria bacterium]
MSNNKLGRLSLITYAGPGLPIAVLEMPLIVYIVPFYAGELGLELATIGGIFLIARMWDAITDPVIGNLSDRTKTKWGRRKPWLLFGSPLLMIGVIAFLSPPEELGKVYLGVTAFLFYIAWTLVQIPYLSWGAELSRDYSERTRINSYRETGRMLGVLIATILPILVLSSPDPSVREILEVYVVALLVLIPLSTLLAVWITPKGHYIENQDNSLFKALKILPKNKPFLRFLCGIFCLWLGGAIFNTVIVFLFQYLLELPRSDFLKLVLLQYILGIAFVPLWLKIADKIGRHRALVIGGFGFLAILPLYLLATPGVFWHAVVIFCIAGPMTSVIWVMPPALTADTIEYGMMKGGSDHAALYMAMYNFVMKMALAFGVGLAMPLLGALGFNPMGENTAEAMRGFIFVALFLPMIVGLPGALILFNYPLTKAKHATIRRYLSKKGMTELS